LWAAGQNVVRTSSMIENATVRSGREAQRQIVAAVHSCDGSIISESAMIPLLAGQRPILLDAFAFHVAVRNRPEIERDLAERIARREFACVVIEQDPDTPRGHAWYSHVNLTSRVVESMRHSYQLERTIAGERFYRAVQ
jgi:hypothetical protein